MPAWMTPPLVVAASSPLDPVVEVRPALLLFGLLLCYAALVAVHVALAPPVVRLGRDRRGSATRPGLGGIADRMAHLAEVGLHHGPWTNRLEDVLDRSGIRVPAGRFLVRFSSLCLVTAFVGSAVGGPALAIVLLVAIGVGTKVLISFRISRRRAQFADQLDDTLQLLAGSLRAGHSLMQAVNTVAHEAPEPTASEFRRIVSVTRVGQDLAVALDTTIERTGSDDFAWIAQAIAIHREVGGNLASVLDSVAGTIRDRNQIRRQVQALSAEGRLSAVVLMGLPVVVVLFLSMMNPGYLARFWESLAGIVMMVVAGFLMTAGALWLRTIVRVEF